MTNLIEVGSKEVVVLIENMQAIENKIVEIIEKMQKIESQIVETIENMQKIEYFDHEAKITLIFFSKLRLFQPKNWEEKEKIVKSVAWTIKPLVQGG